MIDLALYWLSHGLYVVLAVGGGAVFLRSRPDRGATTEAVGAMWAQVAASRPSGPAIAAMFRLARTKAVLPDPERFLGNRGLGGRRPGRREGAVRSVGAVHA